MKKFFKYIFVAVAALCLGANAANASEAANFYYEGGSTGLRRWFTWHWNYSTNQPRTGAKGLLMINGVTDSHANNEVFVHVVKDGTRYRFYCDEECRIECIGLGVTNSWTGFGILWKGVFNCNNEVDHFQNGFVQNYTISEDDPSISSPKDITEFLYMITNAAAALQKAMLDQPADPHAAHVKNLLITSEGHTDLSVHFCMHNTYDFTAAESRYRKGDFNGFTGNVKSINLGYAYVSYNGIVQYPKNIYFERSATNFVGSDSDNALLSVNPDYTSGASASNTYYINFSLGHSNSPVEIDNNTNNPNDVAVRVNHNGLFMMENVIITNDKATIDDANTYAGIGVKLASGGDYSYHNAAVELGNDRTGLGNAVIQGQRVGIDAYAGVIRLKYTSGNVLNKNVAAASIEKGVMLGKWAKDISSFTGHDVKIALKDANNWYSGDIVFASGRTRLSDQGLTESAYVHGEYVCPLSLSDLSHLKYAPETDLSQTYDIVFDASGVPANVDYEFPVFRLDLPYVYNTRTKTWYPYLNAALNDTGTSIYNGENLAIQDGDEIVYYGNVLEPDAVTINNDITIRTAQAGYQPDIDAAPTRYIDSGGYTSYYGGSGASFITVAEGKSVTFGDDISGKTGNYTINMQGNGRAIDAYGTVNANAHFAIRNGKITTGSNPNGGAIRIRTSGTLNLTDARIEGNTASGHGNAIYQDGTMNVSGSPTFGSSDYVYLPEGKVITKVGAFNPTAAVPVKLQNEVNGRDILVSNPGVQSTDPGVVSDSDLTKLNVVLATVNRFAVAYNASGLNGSGSPANVIELQEGHGDILIKKTGLKASDSVEFTVCLSGSSTPVYTVVLSGIDNDGSQVSVMIKELPVGSYTVAETGWSWAYNCASPSVTDDVIPDACTEFAFVNTEDTTTPDYAESNKNNVFN